jgi:hypothetical protein
MVQAAAAFCAMSVAACGVSTTEQAYTAPLIQQVGTGSSAMARLVPTLQAEAKTAGVFSDPTLQQPEAYLVQGQLNKLSAHDLFRMASANHNAATHVGAVITKFDQLAASMTAAAINASSYQSLPDGSKAFITHWNEYLRTVASALHGVRTALASADPVYGEFQGLLRAAYYTASLHSTVLFDKVRQRVLNDIRPLYARMQQARQPFQTGMTSERSLVSFVNRNQQAQAIVTKVNQEYPHGFLAQEFKNN